MLLGLTGFKLEMGKQVNQLRVDGVLILGTQLPQLNSELVWI